MSSTPTRHETFDVLNGALHAFVRVRPTGQPSAAEGPLHGWDIGIKDCFDLAGEIASVGTPMFSARRATRTATAVQRLLDAGANDYMSKPFGIGEMMARIRAFMRAHVAAEVAKGIG